MIFVLTGAGVSADSGVATFRDPDGVWARYDYREVATPEGFARNPALVHEFYNARRRALANVCPNPAHAALARLERALADRGGELVLVTQNVDDLHERAGSRRVIHMHGELLNARCGACGRAERHTGDLSVVSVCARCGRAGFMRPDVVWFGEVPMFLPEIDAALEAAGTFVSIGTSGTVYPAASLVARARRQGVRTVELNLEPSENARLFDHGHYGPAAEIVPEFVSSVLDEPA